VNNTVSAFLSSRAGVSCGWEGRRVRIEDESHRLLHVRREGRAWWTHVRAMPRHRSDPRVCDRWRPRGKKRAV